MDKEMTVVEKLKEIKRLFKEREELAEKGVRSTMPTLKAEKLLDEVMKEIEYEQEKSKEIR